MDDLILAMILWIYAILPFVDVAVTVLFVRLLVLDLMTAGPSRVLRMVTVTCVMVLVSAIPIAFIALRRLLGADPLPNGPLITSLSLLPAMLVPPYLGVEVTAMLWPGWFKRVTGRSRD